MDNIFDLIKKENLILGFKFENIEYFRDNNYSEIWANKRLFTSSDLENIKKILNKKVTLQETEHFSVLPFPVKNSKFNNYVTIFNGEKFIFFQKNMPKKIEYFNISNNSIFSVLKDIVIDKLKLIKEKYRYNQIVFPWLSEKEMKEYYFLWNEFRKKENISKFVGNLYFSYFMEVGYEPSS